MDTENTLTSIRDFYVSRGLKLDCTPSYLRRLLSKEMGKQRLANYDRLVDQKLAGFAETAEQYRFFESSREVNLAFSFAAKVTLATNCWIADQFNRISRDGWQVADLGCSVGLLTYWLSRRHPSIRFSGYDMVDTFVDIASTENQDANIKFARWDYSLPYPYPEEKLDCLVTCLGIDFKSENLHQATDPNLLRDSEYYTFKKQEAESYLHSWRGAVKDGAYACSVLRIPDYVHFLAVADAAYECGWNLDLENSEIIHVDGQKIPGLIFRAEQARENSQIELQTFWADQQIEEETSVYIGAAALLRYQQLKEKEIIDNDSKYYDGDGHTMVTSVGRSNKGGFSFSMATTGYVRLELTSNDQEIPTVQFDW